ncbi:MAG: caspase family protein [Marinoscillum sp.]
MFHKPLILSLLILQCIKGMAQVDLIVPLGHSRKIVDFTVSPDNQWMASVDGSNEVKVWDFQTTEEVYHFKGHENATVAVAYHPIENVLVSADVTGKCITWDQGGTKLWSVHHGENISALAFSQSGDTLITIGGSKMKLWLESKLLDTWTSKIEKIEAATLTSDHQLVIGGTNGSVETYHLGRGNEKKSIRVSESDVLTMTSFSGQVFIGTQKGELISLNLKTLESKKERAMSLRVYDLTYVPSVGTLFAAGRDDKENLRAFDSDLKSTPLGIDWKEDTESEAFAFGIGVIKCNSDTTLLIADYNNRIRAYDFKNKKWSKSFKGRAAAIYDLSVDRTGTKLAIASNHDVIKVLDLTGTASDITFSSSAMGSRAIDFHPVNPVVAAYGLDEQITVTNLINNKTVFSLKANGKYRTTPVTFDPTGRYVLRKSSEEDFDFYNFQTSKPQNLKVKNGKDYVFSPDGRKLIFHTNNGIAVFDPITFQKLTELNLTDVQSIAISPSGMLTVLQKDDLTTDFYSLKDLTKTGSIQLSASSDVLKWSPDGKFLIGIRNSVKRGEPASDYSVKIYDPENGQVNKTLPGHSGFTYDIEFVNNKMLTAGLDGIIRIWELDGKSQEELGMLIPFEGQEYVVTTPKGLYDATAGASGELHYTKAGKLIALDQIKDHYYEPKLLSKILGLNSEQIRVSNNISGVGLYPEISLEHPLKNDGKLGINLNNSGGGIGRVLILINGKEVSSDVRAASTPANDRSLEIDYDITDHPFLYNDRVNKITIKAYNQDGSLSSDEKSLYVFGENKALEPPSLYAIIAGSSDYKGESLDLKYAAKDATDLANALNLSASKYLGAEKTNITLLTTEQEQSQWPTKQNIQKAFDEYKTKAKANDILFVYLAGHGVNQSGENSDFYYLTCSAESGDMNNTVLREESAISSREFTEYIKSVPALKQIMIIDACHSGRLASSLGSSRSAVSSTQIRALERMKDRTGLFVLAGSAADAVSYETTLYGQGLLTYSLLFGMKGAALRDDEFIDVLSLFQFAANKVPELAEEIGGIQKPEVSLPSDGKSFDIGRLSTSDRELIKIASPKPVYVHTRFQDESAIFDRLGVSDLLDSKLIEMSKQKDPKLVFVDDKDFSGATIINGRYEDTNGLLKAKLYFIKDNQVAQKELVEAVNADQLTDEIIRMIEQFK